MPRGLAQRRTIFMPGMGAPNTSNKLGFTTYAMWALLPCDTLSLAS